MSNPTGDAIAAYNKERKMTKDTLKECRAAFEAWVIAEILKDNIPEGVFEKSKSGKYYFIQDRFEAFQAAWNRTEHKPDNKGVEGERQFPIMKSDVKSVPWSVAAKAYKVYAAEYGYAQTLERLAERGGFYDSEMNKLYPQWRDEVCELEMLRKQLKALNTKSDIDHYKTGVLKIKNEFDLPSGKMPARPRKVKPDIVQGEWIDTDDEYTEAIKAAHPLKTGDHKTRQKALEMVNNRHSKSSLVDLVNYLLKQPSSEDKLREALNNLKRQISASDYEFKDSFILIIEQALKPEGE